MVVQICQATRRCNVTEIIAGIIALIALALGAVGGQIFGRMRGKREGKKDAEDDAVQDDLETGRRIDQVRSLDAGAARQRLRDRTPKP